MQAGAEQMQSEYTLNGHLGPGNDRVSRGGGIVDTKGQ